MNLGLRYGKATEMMTLTVNKSSSEGYEVYDLIKDSKWGVIEMQLIDDRISVLETKVKYGNYSEEIMRRTAIPD